MAANNSDFLAQLQGQAQKQAQLHHHRLIPKKLDAVTSVIGRYPWQVLLVISGLSAVVVTVGSL
jgi:hypothetical protein